MSALWEPANTELFIVSVLFLFFLYGCSTWSVTLREERGLRVFENMLLRKMFRPKRDEVTVVWRRLHNEERHELCRPPNIVLAIKSRIRWTGSVARIGDRRGADKVMVGRPEGYFGRPKHRWG